MAHGITVKSGQHVRKIPGQQAQRLGDLNGVQRDLDFIARSCRVIDHRKGSPSTDHIRKACFDSAVMRYRRCFNSGIRELVPKEMLEKLTDNQKELHDRILKLADWSIAHCVEGSEENIPILLIGPSSDNKTMLEISVMSASVSHHNVINIKKFEALSQKISKLVRAECEKISKKLMKDILKLGPDGVSSFPNVTRNITEKGEIISEKYHGKMKEK